MFGIAPPHLRGIELREAQQDKLFALLHERAPRERELGNATAKAWENLRRLASADLLDGKQAPPAILAGARRRGCRQAANPTARGLPVARRRAPSFLRRPESRRAALDSGSSPE
jgi:hypothetical protein